MPSDGMHTAPAQGSWLGRQDLRDSSADFSDALITTLCRNTGCKHTLTFDRTAARHPGFALLK